MVRYKLSELTINTFFSAMNVAIFKIDFFLFEFFNKWNISQPTILRTRYTEPNCFSLYNFKLKARIVFGKNYFKKGQNIWASSISIRYKLRIALISKYYIYCDGKMLAVKLYICKIVKMTDVVRYI